MQRVGAVQSVAACAPVPRRSLASGGWSWGEHVDVLASGGGGRVQLRFRGLEAGEAAARSNTNRPNSAFRVTRPNTRNKAKIELSVNACRVAAPQVDRAEDRFQTWPTCHGAKTHRFVILFALAGDSTEQAPLLAGGS